MEFRRRANIKSGWGVSEWIPFVNVFVLVVFFYVLTTAFTLAPNIDVRIPKAVTSDALIKEDSVILITSENVIYWRNSLVSVKDLRQSLSKASADRLSILIKADRRASVGRIVDIWNLCKSLGIERINIATTSE